jgi:hypothetical protein
MAADNDKTSMVVVLNAQGTNYEEWGARLKFTLLTKGLPNALTDDTNATVSSKALGYLGQSLDPCYHEDVMSCTTAKQAWTKLQALFSKKNQAMLSTLEDEFHSAKHSPQQESVHQYVNKLVGLQRRLMTAGVHVGDESLNRTIIRGLPSDTYGTFSERYLHGKATYSLEELKTALQNIEAGAKHKSQDKAVVLQHTGPKPFKPNQGRFRGGGSSSRTYNNNKGNRQPRPFSGACHYCQKVGHMLKDCRKKKADDRRSGADGGARNSGDGYGGYSGGNSNLVLCATKATDYSRPVGGGQRCHTPHHRRPDLPAQRQAHHRQRHRVWQRQHWAGTRHRRRHPHNQGVPAPRCGAA